MAYSITRPLVAVDWTVSTAFQSRSVRVGPILTISYPASEVCTEWQPWSDYFGSRSWLLGGAFHWLIYCFLAVGFASSAAVLVRSYAPYAFHTGSTSPLFLPPFCFHSRLLFGRGKLTYCRSSRNKGRLYPSQVTSGCQKFIYLS